MRLSVCLSVCLAVWLSSEHRSNCQHEKQSSKTGKQSALSIPYPAWRLSKRKPLSLPTSWPSHWAPGT
ncbi:hypothetical protein SeMB42_g03898 [Synchytrium endobioticum]|uniref:Uncharacterized protein n=1 Tax=Synchytrium endobioticum TaxID=286115 RepID=A0A507D2K9_9FUNG|nr:hypothetical protein SeMB42_g03898 [Synchytrium endobioticum]